MMCRRGVNAIFLFPSVSFCFLSFFLYFFTPDTFHKARDFNRTFLGVEKSSLIDICIRGTDHRIIRSIFLGGGGGRLGGGVRDLLNKCLFRRISNVIRPSNPMLQTTDICKPCGLPVANRRTGARGDTGSEQLF